MDLREISSHCERTDVLKQEESSKEKLWSCWKLRAKRRQARGRVCPRGGWVTGDTAFAEVLLLLLLTWGGGCVSSACLLPVFCLRALTPNYGYLDPSSDFPAYPAPPPLSEATQNLFRPCSALVM